MAVSMVVESTALMERLVIKILSHPEAAVKVSPTQTTVYTITGTNTQGCTSYGMVTVTVLIKYNVFVPNVFSANSSQHEHNRFYVYGHNIEAFDLIIYNRWGHVVFKSSDVSPTLRQDGLCCRYGAGWDGTTNNSKELNLGVFVFKLTGSYTNGEKFFEFGNITLIK